jgi:hypothetical protein
MNAYGISSCTDGFYNDGINLKVNPISSFTPQELDQGSYQQQLSLKLLWK